MVHGLFFLSSLHGKRLKVEQVSQPFDATRKPLSRFPSSFWRPLGGGKWRGFFVERLRARASMQPIQDTTPVHEIDDLRYRDGSPGRCAGSCDAIEKFGTFFPTCHGDSVLCRGIDAG